MARYTLANGIVLESEAFDDGRVRWRALRPTDIEAPNGGTVFTPAGAFTPGWRKSAPSIGHVDGDYSKVQGGNAPCCTFTTWRRAIAALPAIEGLVTT